MIPVWTAVRVGLFVLGGAAIGYLSRSCLRNPSSHGFYRFFAFLALLALILWNLPRWFAQPFVARQLVSWLMLVISLSLALAGFGKLLTAGKPRRGIETTTRLVTSGLYQYIRHPLYSSLLFLGWGAFLKDVSWVSGALVVAASGFLYLTAYREERENLERFGKAYAVYMGRTRRFIPFIF